MGSQTVEATITTLAVNEQHAKARVKEWLANLGVSSTFFAIAKKVEEE